MESKGKILIVDDSRIVRKVMSSILLKEQYEVLEASDGETSIALAREQYPDIIILDIVMPGMDGFETCKELKADKLTSDIPVIFITATADNTDDKVKGFEAGGVDYILKPFQTEEVLARVKTHLHVASLSKQLHSYTLKLQRSHAKLEERVKARTHALSEANKALHYQMEKRQRAENEVRKSEQEFRMLFENQLNAIAVGDNKGKFIRVNRSFCELLETTEKEIIGKTALDIIHPDERETFIDLVTKVQKNILTNFTTEVRILTAKARTIDALVYVNSTYDEKGNLKTTALSITDITTRKAAERAKSEFISIVSHELRTPLTSIRGSFGLMSATLPENNSQAKALLDIAISNSQRLEALIDDLLDIGRIEGGTLEIDCEDKLVDQLMERAAKLNESYASELEVELELELNAPGTQIYIDTNRIQQILSNLISNAVKFSPRGSCVKLVTEIEDETVALTVVDQGPGIPDEFSDQIFDRFTQISSADDRNKNGTGLGLYISKKLATAMNGQLDFVSIPNEGSKFFLKFPITKSPAKQSNAAQASELKTITSDNPDRNDDAVNHNEQVA